ncbi:caspase family protein [Candidatus Thiodictyon syntrophicum]|jgi:hypothetical protein|uniref:Peptidase C14 caspase domain-containing protein n=1 Tax=Candidatus Thiodictyon syntrophicum TaxID=1166950 RepID=A0A2K8U435_9GAMM|nr:caspase family protein [Candidatus Thiodictyon syntrophicum]AUB79801.1 hypothetical protein THSYN_01705 [Candidatus Thiodictyon syntrophicum]
MNKAAIVIGVNRTGNLPVLAAAVTGAVKVGDWLRREGFHVEKCLDTRGPVTAADLFQKIAELVDQGTLEQLVVYFSGHGFLNNGSEHWMLSGAPADPNQAVSLAESALLARECGIPSVVFISDACRSVPQDLRADRVRGSLIFPNQGAAAGVEVEVDRFLATLPGDPALEMPLPDSAGQFEGIYTTCFLKAFQQPDPDMIRTLSVEGKTVRVVPNRGLKAYLRREVNQLAQDKAIRLRQLPQSIVESGEACYLGRVAPRRSAAARGLAAPPMPTVLSVTDVARFELRRSAENGPAAASFSIAMQDTPARSAFDASLAVIERADAPGHFETQTGFAVVGAEVAAVHGIGVGAEVVTPGGPGAPALVRVHPGARPTGSLILRFADGSGTLLATLNGFVGSLVVDGGRVMSLSYVPADNNWRWADYQQQRPRLERLRAVVAAAAGLGVFQLDRDRAAAMADEIRYLKCIDPSLGLYAAYAYSDAGLRERIRSVQEYLRGDLGADLFDIAMLAGTLSGRPAGAVPGCPMLTQGWGLLRVKGVHLPLALAAAGEHLRSALWTTFESAGMDIIEAAFHQGELT